jgi:hypothetical protein
VPKDYAKETETGESSAHVVVGDRSHYGTAGSAGHEIVLDQLPIVRLGDSCRAEAENNGAYTNYMRRSPGHPKPP